MNVNWICRITRRDCVIGRYSRICTSPDQECSPFDDLSITGMQGRGESSHALELADDVLLVTSFVGPEDNLLCRLFFIGYVGDVEEVRALIKQLLLRFGNGYFLAQHYHPIGVAAQTW